ncbi:MAG: transporter, partial [Verrucomicrobiales bacterium]|nr:transporter [Verrucomicrobiales bacterium]
LRNPHAHGGGHGHGGAGSFGHSSAGLGDITVGGLYKIYDTDCHRLHLNLGLVLPVAEVDKKEHGAFLPYGMQPGSGTWDLKPGITYLGQAANLSWGAQAIAIFRLEDENDSGFSYGDNVNVTAWVAHPICDAVSVSARLNFIYSDSIDGHYNGPHGHVAPPHFQANYGGHILEGGLGVNVMFKNGHRLAIESLVPLAQDANGVGMDREFGVVVGWQKAF